MAVKQFDLIQGTLDLLILQTLALGPNHGYAIAQRIHQLSDDVLRVEEGSLYPALYRLEQKGLVESEWRVTELNRKAKYYRLTRLGRRESEAEREGWVRLSGGVTRLLRAIQQEA
jgi:PadR family transcriptional regulator, regulatory protein PadR